MPKTKTCGSPKRATEFEYEGSVAQGVTLNFKTGDIEVTSRFLAAIRAEFAGRRVAGGFKMDDPPPEVFAHGFKTIHQR